MGVETELQFGPDPLSTTCLICNDQVCTVVVRNIKQSGQIFSRLVSSIGSWLGSLVVSGLPGFWRFRHFCPRCGALIGVGELRHSKGQIAAVIITTMLAVGVITGV